MLNKTKKLTYSIILTTLIGAFIFSNPSAALLETVAAQGAYYRGEYLFTTYYPSPFGAYQQLHVGDGIGNPEYDLDVVRNNGTARIVVKSNSDDSTGFHIIKGGSNPAAATIGYGGGTTLLKIGNEGTFGTKHLVIDTSGNIGIGTTNPGAKVEIAGTSDATQFIVRANSTQSIINSLMKFVSSDGAELLRIHSDDISNLFIGANAGRVNTITVQVLPPVTTGIFNTFVGSNSGYFNVGGSDNTALGSKSLYSNTDGYRNTAIGKESLYLNADGYRNSALGWESLYSNTEGYNNIAIGAESLYSNQSGFANTAVGYMSLNLNITGAQNTALGIGSLEYNTGSYNTVVGAYGLMQNTTGSNNTALGANTGGSLKTAKNSVYIGYGAKGYSNADDNSIVIGYNAVGIGANAVVLGNNLIVTTALKGNVGIGTTDPKYKLDIIGDVRATGSIYYGGTTGNADGSLYSKPDYVFSKGYNPMTTEEVGIYLKKENHLPWITPLKDEKNDAIDMTRMGFETVETAENLQLQIIELNKIIKTQNKDIEELKQEVRQLKKLKNN